MVNKQFLNKAAPFLWLLLAAVILFLPGLLGDGRLVSLDDKALMQQIYGDIISGSSMNSGWNHLNAGGWPNYLLPYNIRTVLAPVMDAESVLQLSYLLSLLLGGCGFFLFMRHKKLDRSAALFGAIGWMLTGSVVTLIMPGHLGKLLALGPLPFFFLFIRKATVDENRFSYIYAAFFLALSLWGRGYEMTVYFGILGGAYWLWLLSGTRKAGEKLLFWVKRNKKRLVEHLGLGLLLAVLTVLLGAMVFPALNRSSDTRGGQVKRMQSTTAKWKWATQWSLPPEELIDFVVPGLFGWKSNDPDTPYWGRLGRDPNWDSYTPQQQQRAMRNMKLNSESIGLLLFLLALFALLVRLRELRDETRFWLAAGGIALLLALGKFLYVPYYIFYQLPFMDLFRNPNKFVKPVAFAFAVLGAHGFQLLFVRFREKLQESDPLRLRLAGFIKGLRWTFTGFGALALLSFLLQSKISGVIAENLGRTQGADNVAGYFPVAFLIAALVSGFLYFVTTAVYQRKLTPRRLQLLGYAAVALLAGELLLTDRHFVNFVNAPQQTRYNYGLPAENLIQGGLPPALFDETKQGAVIRAVSNHAAANSSNPFPLRVWMKPTGPWLKLLGLGKFNRLGIERTVNGINASVSPRVGKMFAAVTANYSEVDRLLKLLRLNPRYRAHLQQNYFRIPVMLGNPALINRFPEQQRAGAKAQLQQIFAKIRRQWAQCARLSGAHYVITDTANLPAGAGILDWTKGKSYPVLKRIPWEPVVAVVSNPFPRLYLASAVKRLPDTPQGVLQNSAPLKTPAVPQSLAGMSWPAGGSLRGAKIEFVSYANNEIRIRYAAPVAAVAVLTDLYHPDWHAELDGKPLKVFPVNYLQRGVVVPAGKGVLVYRYQPESGVMTAFYAGFFIVLLTLAVHGCIVLRRRKNRAVDNRDTESSS